MLACCIMLSLTALPMHCTLQTAQGVQSKGGAAVLDRITPDSLSTRGLPRSMRHSALRHLHRLCAAHAWPGSLRGRAPGVACCGASCCVCRPTWTCHSPAGPVRAHECDATMLACGWSRHAHETLQAPLCSSPPCTCWHGHCPAGACSGDHADQADKLGVIVSVHCRLAAALLAATP